jgi:hypothetical protein
VRKPAAPPRSKRLSDQNQQWYVRDGINLAMPYTAVKAAEK